MKRKRMLAAKILAGIAVFGMVAFVFFVLVILPRLDPSGDYIPPFLVHNDLAISKTAPDGTPYTVNNSTATFRLDIAKPDKHAVPVFRTYADAVRYCQSNGLPVLPSVQVIQGKLKTLDDAFCIALERAMRERQRQALAGLLERLVANHAPGEAIVYVGTALSLEGFEPDGLDSDTRQRIDARRAEFLTTPDAQPLGFWEEQDDLRKAYQSDRYLMNGLSLHTSAETCIAISRAIAEDAGLTASFQALRTFGAKLTNPAESPPPEAIASLTPEGIRQRFPADARFALVSYSTSHEAVILQKLNSERAIPDHANLMPLIIEAVRSGRLLLDPIPDSGWYDYQWHALETLLVPERGHESAKLRLSAAYRERLENAFASTLTKERETHIKRLPYACLGGSDGNPSLPKVTIAPDFSAEPTLTVYLRFGRGYRFLRQAMSAVFQEDWATLRFSDSSRPLDDALNEAALFCYGLYETLCLEVGQKPHYLPDELEAFDREQAVATFTRWHETWPDDSALTNDTRVAAPVAQWNTGGSVRHWGTAGVRLEAAVYTYLDHPEVEGKVQEEFVPCTVYLPTDIFIEFNSPSPMTRTAFRSLCDTCADAVAIRQTFGYTPSATAKAGRSFALNAVKNYWGWLAAISVGVLLWKVRRTRVWIVSLGVTFIIVWGCCFAFSPYYRTSFIVRRIAPINEPLGQMCKGSIRYSTASAPVLKALADLYNHPNPQVRYLAMYFLADTTCWRCGLHNPDTDSDTWFQSGAQDNVMKAVNDPDPEIAMFAVYALRESCHRTSEVADLLLAKLPTAKWHDTLCSTILYELGHMGDPRAIEVIQPFCEDPRDNIRFAAIEALKCFPQPETQPSTKGGLP